MPPFSFPSTPFSEFCDLISAAGAWIVALILLFLEPSLRVAALARASKTSDHLSSIVMIKMTAAAQF